MLIIITIIIIIMFTFLLSFFYGKQQEYNNIITLIPIINYIHSNTFYASQKMNKYVQIKNK